MSTLAQVNYPGYAADIVALGIVEKVAPIENGGYELTLRTASDREEVLREIASRIHQLLAHELGVPKVEFKLHRLEAELGEKTGRVRLAGTRYVVAVASGKGGVGKRPRLGGAQNFYPVEKYGVKLISMGFFLDDKSPVIWRGPMVMGAVRQFLKDTLWGTQDFLIVDLPPGTGDAQLTLAQQVSIDGAVIVTTPQEVAVADALRAVRMLRQVHCPLIGVVENMSYFVCPDCGERDEIFGAGGGEKMAREEGMELLARIPIHPEVRETGDDGMPIVIKSPDHPASQAFMEVARRVIAAMPKD